MHEITIKLLSTLTGVPVPTLRSWETRHQLIRPERSTGGHRLYGFEDIEKVRLIKRLTTLGQAVSRLSQKSTSELQGLLLRLDPLSLSPDEQMRTQPCTDAGEREELASLLACLVADKTPVGLSLLKRSLLYRGFFSWRGTVLVPLLAELQSLVDSGEVSEWTAKKWREGVTSILSLMSGLIGENTTSDHSVLLLKCGGEAAGMDCDLIATGLRVRGTGILQGAEDQWVWPEESAPFAVAVVFRDGSSVSPAGFMGTTFRLIRKKIPLAVPLLLVGDTEELGSVGQKTAGAQLVHGLDELEEELLRLSRI